MDPIPEISIVIVNYNGSKYLQQCINSLYETKGELELEIWVVDNGSSDDSVALLREQYPEVKRIENSENLGFTKANNQAIRQAVGHYIMLLNNDTIVQSHALQRMLGVMNTHPELAAVGPRLLNEDGSLQPSCLHFPSLWEGVLNYFKSRAGGSAKYVPPLDNHLEIVDTVIGACMLIRREALEEIGLLDEGFFIYAEETDWCYRAARLGWQVGYVPDATVIHLISITTKREPVRFYVERRYGRVRFYLKHYGRLQARIESALVRLNILIRWLIHPSQRQEYSEILRLYNTRVLKLFRLDDSTARKTV